MTEEQVSDRPEARIRSAASLLVKGGSLINEACSKCGGVQVKFGDKVTCVNCGNETTTAVQEPKPESAPAIRPDLAAAAGTIEDKITSLVAEIKTENDTAIQRQKAELIEAYLRILEKLRLLTRKQ